MKRVRHTHAKFAALNLNSSNNEEAEGGLSDIGGFGSGGVGGEEEGVGIDDDKVDERPWSLKGKRKVKGVEIGEENAADCVRWMGGKVLEHAGFQGLFCFVSRVCALALLWRGIAVVSRLVLVFG